MAATIPAQRVERTQRATFKFDDGRPALEIVWETAWIDPNGLALGQPSFEIKHRSAADFEGRTWTLSDGNSLTADQLLEAVMVACNDLALA
ncbi:MAG: hypothetical protein EKK41_21190 [Hyphomicrobiales bacterium]|nr:MAG: hypothetical protein EKK41_21190 [Hyphomicrobiales bacterium]